MLLGYLYHVKKLAELVLKPLDNRIADLAVSLKQPFSSARQVIALGFNQWSWRTILGTFYQLCRQSSAMW